MSELGLHLGELSAGAFGEDGKRGFCSVGVGSRGLVAHWFRCFKFCSPGLTTGYELDIITTIGVGWVISPRLGLGFSMNCTRDYRNHPATLRCHLPILPAFT